MKLLLIFALCWGLSLGLTWEQKYKAWAADLQPGYTIVIEHIDGQKCHCKIPEPSTSTTTITTQEPITEAENTTNSTRDTTTSTSEITTIGGVPAVFTTISNPTSTATTPTATSTTTTQTSTSTTTTTPTSTSTSTTPTSTSTTTTPTSTSTTPTTQTSTSTTTTPTSTSTTTLTSTSTTTTTPTSTSTTTTTPTSTSTTTTTPTSTSTTTTTPTSTSTTTTTPTSTSTTTTPTSTSTTTTPTSTSTSTTTTTTTTSTPSTTPAPEVAAYECNKTIIISHDSLDYWQSPNYPEPYPEDITCTLTIIIPEQFMMATAVIKALEPSIITSTGKCGSSPDHLTYLDTMNVEVHYCGTISNKEWGMLVMYDSPKSATFTFVSSSADNKADIGFKLEISGYNLMVG